MALTYDRGLALYLYPGELLRFGALHSLAADEAVSAEHYFVCLSTDAQGGTWMPLHPTRGKNRLPIMETAKTGRARFTQGVSWYSPTELWRIPHKAVQRAAQLAGDKSTAAAQNRVASASLPTVSPPGVADVSAR